MKKIITILGALMLMASAASAQNVLGGILNSLGGGNIGETISNVITGITGGGAVDLTGTWNYNGVGAAVRGDNILSTVAGNAAVSTIETRADNILAKAGIAPGTASFTFNQDGTFLFQAGRWIKLNGTYVQNGNAVTMKFGKALTYLQMDGTVSATTDGCKILFNGERFMTFAQKVIEYARKITTSAGVATVGNILSTAKSLDAGFKLTR